MLPIEVFAPAKVNLALHVTGRRADGYHLLDSLVAFAPVGDWLTLAPAGPGAGALAVAGPEAAGVPADGRNLVLRAMAAWAAAGGPVPALALRLEKILPPASGIGGGSSDAAAVLRGLAHLAAGVAAPVAGGGLAVPGGGRLDLAALGADLPMCLVPAPARVGGVGEVVVPAALPPLPAVLVNPRVEVATPAVFAALARRDGAPLPPLRPFADAGACIDWLEGTRNDLEPAARALAPQIGAALAALAALPGARLVRMSGSGATCFALFAQRAAAEAGAARLRAARPGWWVAAGCLGDQVAAAAPRPAARAAAQSSRATT